MRIGTGLYIITGKENDTGTKKVNFNQKGIENLPNDKPVLYKIQTGSGGTNYAGIAQKGKVQEDNGGRTTQIPSFANKYPLQFHYRTITLL